jgi:hypothetical protein
MELWYFLHMSSAYFLYWTEVFIHFLKDYYSFLRDRVFLPLLPGSWWKWDSIIILAVLWLDITRIQGQLIWCSHWSLSFRKRHIVSDCVLKETRDKTLYLWLTKYIWEFHTSVSMGHIVLNQARHCLNWGPEYYFSLEIKNNFTPAWNTWECGIRQSLYIIHNA